MNFDGSPGQGDPNLDPNPVATPAAAQELDTLCLPSPPVDEAHQHHHAPPAPEDLHAPPMHPAQAIPPVQAPPVQGVPPVPAPVPEQATPAQADPNGNVMATNETAVETGLNPYAYSTPADTGDFKRSYALTFSVRKKPKSIFAMAMGLPEFQGMLERPPLSALKRKELTDLYVPKADDFKYEIKRRAHFFMNVPDDANYFTEDLNRQHPLKTKRSSIVLPQPSQWLNSHLKNWLLERPMRPNDNDVNFLRAEIHKALEYLTKENNVEGGATPIKHDSLPQTPVAQTPVATTPSIPRTNSDPIASPIPAVMTTPSVQDIETEPYNYVSEADSDEYKRSASVNFLQRGEKARYLLAMALGMPENYGLLNHPPFTVIKRKDLTDEYIPRAEDYRFEIKRRAHFFMNVGEEANYYIRDLKGKNPLENMRGIVALPQPNQWKLQALKKWLSERPLKPNEQDTTFLTESITKHVDALNIAIQNDPSQGAETPAKKARGKQEWTSPDANSVGSNQSGPLASSSKKRESLLLECITKQDAILGAVTKQNQQQAILNKITVLTQAISGYQQEISSLRATINETENRMLTVEMKIAEAPESAERLNVIMAKQEEAKSQTLIKLKEFQQLIDESRKKIENHSKELEELETMDISEMATPSSSRKRKFDEDTEPAGDEAANGDKKGEPQETPQPAVEDITMI